ncbi:MAG TPA: TetR/AcrR family transcriptional regulator [Sphingobium sp.]|uniref:TetR/AcrR family transcriptional regulator n=1 Tax=Sphingobium sp. TaxID=1912891 RepID=UPI002ED5DCF7
MNRRRIRDNPEVRRAQILEEGLKLVGKHGYYGLTVQALAKQCGISNAGLLYYFSSKDQILLGLLDELERREAELIAPVVDAALLATGGEARRSALTRMMRAMVERVMGQGSLGRFITVLQAEALDHSHPAHDWFVERERLTIDLLASLLEEVLPHSRSAARQLYAMMHGLGLQWFRTDGAFNLIEEWDRASGCILGAGTAAA